MRTRQYRYWEDMRGDRHHASPMHTVAGFPYVADGMPADCADCSPGYYVEAYRETLDRLRDAQARYELNRDDRASDAAVRDAIRDVLVARADLEHIRRRHPELLDAVYVPESRCPKCGGYSGASWIGRACQNAPRGVLCMGILEPMPPTGGVTFPVPVPN